MKVLHICYSDSEGGAAKAAYRLHKAQCESGIESFMLVVRKCTDDPSVYTLSGRDKFLLRLKSYIARKILKLQNDGNSVLHSLNIFSSGLIRKIKEINPDIVNLHWIGGEMLSIKEINSIPYPLCWTLHDMWAFCGAEHYEGVVDSGRYINGYSEKNKSPDAVGLDINRWIYKKKAREWNDLRCTFIAPSNWMAECVDRSALFRTNNCKVIHNYIDPSVYKPFDKEHSRFLLKLPRDKKLILFGAMSSTSDPRKGYKFLKEALVKIKADDSMAVVIFGASYGDAEDVTGIKTYYLGQLHDDIALMLAYNAADIFVAPSLQDNLPNTLVEALSCGTPCVAFDIGGMPDLVRSSKDGILISDVSSAALARGITDSLNNFANNPILSNELVRDTRFGSDVVFQYKALYESLIQDGIAN